jgi:hypothetical protein
MSEQVSARSLRLDDLGFEREGLERRGVWKGCLLISRRTVLLLFRLVEKRWVFSLLSFRTQCAMRNRRRFAENVVRIIALYSYIP